MIQFKAKYLKALLPFVCPHEIRYYLRGIHIEPADIGGAYLAATDGHTLLLIHDATAICSAPISFHVCRDALKYTVARRSIFPMLKASIDADVRINPITERLTLEAASHELYVQAGKCVIDCHGKFPEWRRVLPNFKKLAPAPCGTLNHKLLQRAMRVADLGSQSSPIRIWTNHKDSAHVVQYEAIPEMIALVMPMRESVKGFSEAMEALLFRDESEAETLKAAA